MAEEHGVNQLPLFVFLKTPVEKLPFTATVTTTFRNSCLQLPQSFVSKCQDSLCVSFDVTVLSLYIISVKYENKCGKALF